MTQPPQRIVFTIIDSVFYPRVGGILSYDDAGYDEPMYVFRITDVTHHDDGNWVIYIVTAERLEQT